MARTKTPGRVATCLLATVLVAFIAAASWAAVDDYVYRGILPPGATVAGVDVGGRTRAAAARVIEQRVKGPLHSPISVTFLGQPAIADPASLTSVDVQALVEKAALPKTTASLPQRVWWRVTGKSYGRDVADVITVDAARVREWVAAEKRRVSVPAVDASISVSGSKLITRAEKPGISFDEASAIIGLSRALLSGTKTMALLETTTTPAVTEKKLGKTIFVSRSKATLTLYQGTTLEKAYRCAVGQPQFPTPLGTWRIVAKVSMPTWRNNGSDWAKNMPAVIAPGPDNPLGTRALYLDASGIRIHGIPPSEDWSIGSPASHGCMRMHRWDVEDLYPRVPVGTRVFIVG
jgi:lipoprotein-anchoring transpeptidase ErfK/SrfK